MILGHAHPLLSTQLEDIIQKGISYGLCAPQEVELAQLITQAYPGLAKVRMVNSGTEATMSAIRAARGFTGRDKIIKFEGCYHGHSDGLLVKSGSGALTFGMPTSPGVPADIVKNTLVGTYNDLPSVEALIAANKGRSLRSSWNRLREIWAWYLLSRRFFRACAIFVMHMISC